MAKTVEPNKPRYKKVSSVLQAARDHLAEPNNWAKGCMVNTKGAVCADGAVQLACGAKLVRFTKDVNGFNDIMLTHLTDEGYQLRAKALDVLGLTVTEDTDKLLTGFDGHVYPSYTHDWNDAQKRTRKQVLAGFDKAISEAKRQERSARKVAA